MRYDGHFPQADITQRQTPYKKDVNALLDVHGFGVQMPPKKSLKRNLATRTCIDAQPLP